MKKTLLGALAISAHLIGFSSAQNSFNEMSAKNSLTTSKLDNCKKTTLLVEDFYTAYQNNDISVLNKIMAKNYTISNAADIHEISYSK